MKILITGASGFAGTHLVEYYKKNSRRTDLFCTVFGGSGNLEKFVKPDQLYEVDLLDTDKIEELVKIIKPDAVIHLAALAAVSQSFQEPQLVLKNNIVAAANLLEAVRKFAKQATVLVIGSADVYGSVTQEEVPLNENASLKPASPYGVSKVAVDFLGLQYFQTYNIKVIRVRPFNHIGEYQRTGFVVPDFAKQIVEAEQKQNQIIKVGNLSAIRDFTDVKDMVYAYALALEKCQPGEVYNIGSGKGVRIQDLLNIMITKAHQTIRIEVDHKLYRPIDVESVISDPAKFQKATGWKSTIPLEATLERVLNYFRDLKRREK